MQAFLRAWVAACSTADPHKVPLLYVPHGYKFLLQHLELKGPCASHKIRVQVHFFISKHLYIYLFFLEFIVEIVSQQTGLYNLYLYIIDIRDSCCAGAAESMDRRMHG